MATLWFRKKGTRRSKFYVREAHLSAVPDNNFPPFACRFLLQATNGKKRGMRYLLHKPPPADYLRTRVGKLDTVANKAAKGGPEPDVVSLEFTHGPTFELRGYTVDVEVKGDDNRVFWLHAGDASLGIPAESSRAWFQNDVGLGRFRTIPLHLLSFGLLWQYRAVFLSKPSIGGGYMVVLCVPHRHFHYSEVLPLSTSPPLTQ